MPLSPEDLSRFISTVDALTLEMRVHEEKLMAANRRSARAQNVATIGVVVGIVGVVVGIGGAIFGLTAQSTTEDLKQARRDGRIATCVQSNLQTQRTREALLSGVSVLTQPDPRRSNTEQAAVDRFVVEYGRKVDGSLPYRDCSERGIDIYYQHPPADPALGRVTTTTKGGS